MLRAQQGHDAATLVEDLLALRPCVEALAGPAPARLSLCLEQALRAGVGALTHELALPQAGPVPTRDLLTGLLSRAVLEEALTHEVLSSARYGAPALVVLDLDGLTRFMEVHGHLAGDLQLVRTAEIVQAASRRSDVLGRLGVDQLAVVLPRTDLTRALVVARRVLARSLADVRAGERADPGSTAGAPVLSVGVGFLPAPQSAAELLAAAEQALGHARRAGGRVVETNRPDSRRGPAGRPVGGRGPAPPGGPVIFRRRPRDEQQPPDDVARLLSLARGGDDVALAALRADLDPPTVALLAGVLAPVGLDALEVLAAARRCARPPGGARAGRRRAARRHRPQPRARRRGARPARRRRPGGPHGRARPVRHAGRPARLPRLAAGGPRRPAHPRGAGRGRGPPRRLPALRGRPRGLDAGGAPGPRRPRAPVRRRGRRPPLSGVGPGGHLLSRACPLA